MYDQHLNLFSHEQVKEWCSQRGVRSASFDKHNVERLIARLKKKQETGNLSEELEEVLALLTTKQQLGGSSPKKLETILNTQYEGRLYDQYVHAGAPQSLRTSGRSVQMQNLPRLSTIRNMDELDSPLHWTNEELSDNLRQVFRASHPKGELYVADFASIESRALAYLAGETWKLEAYARGEDIYKEQAVKIFGLRSVEQVSKVQRTTGKVGELSCGYGAGAGAVKDFAAKMHVDLSEGEAKQLVNDWRNANPAVTQMWRALHDMLMDTVETGRPSKAWTIPGGVLLRGVVRFRPTVTPISLSAIDSKVQSIEMVVQKKDMYLRRVFHGCYLKGGNVGYYKPSTLKGGPAWKRKYMDPKTKQERYYELYGGKLAGILTQSFCREIFFESLSRLDQLISRYDNVQIVGQFHDEIVVEWEPGEMLRAKLEASMEAAMSSSYVHPDLPMAVEVKHAPRYIK
jgi:hypothetical protein